MQQVNQLFEELTPLLLGLACALLSYLIQTATRYIAAKVNNAKFTSATERINEIVNTVVLDLQQTVVEQLKSARGELTPGGARITQDEAKEIATSAFARAVTYLGERGIKQVMDAHGFTDRETFDRFLSSKIESIVNLVRQNTIGPGTVLTTTVEEVDRGNAVQ